MFERSDIDDERTHGGPRAKFRVERVERAIVRGCGVVSHHAERALDDVSRLAV